MNHSPTHYTFSSILPTSMQTFKLTYNTFDLQKTIPSLILPNPYTEQRQIRQRNCKHKSKNGNRKAYESIIERGDKNKLAIWRKLSKRNRRHLIVDESLQEGSRGGIPNLTRSIVTPRNNQGAVPVEMHRRHRHRVRLDHVHRLPRLHIPNSDRVVEPTGDDQIRLWTEVDAEDPVRVALEGFDALGGACVPDAEGAVVGGGADVGGVGGPGEVADALRVAGQAGDWG